jgi:hypothetical protein
MAEGGRGGAVLFVTNLGDYDPATDAVVPGSFRAACNTRGRRTVIFRVSGTISLKADLVIEEPYLTIAGQTAPGEGVCIRGYETRIATHDVIVRYLRFRTGDDAGRAGAAEFYPNALAIGKETWPEDAGGADLLMAKQYFDNPLNGLLCEANRIIVDHCSISWGVDACLAVASSRDVSIQWCIVSEGLDDSTHPSGRHSRGVRISCNATRVTFHHNIIAGCAAWNPLLGGLDGKVFLRESINNLVFNWRDGTAVDRYHRYRRKDPVGRINFESNCYIMGPDSAKIPCLTVEVPDIVYVAGNLGPTRTEPADDQLRAVKWTAAERTDGNNVHRETRFRSAPVTVHEVREACRLMMKKGGASLPRRDSADSRVVADMVNGSGSIINSPHDVGGWPELRSDVAPPDRDRDGMPDAWETTHDLQPDRCADGNRDPDRDGYTNLEEFLNGTDPRVSEEESGEDG